MALRLQRNQVYLEKQDESSAMAAHPAAGSHADVLLCGCDSRTTAVDDASRGAMRGAIGMSASSSSCMRHSLAVDQTLVDSA